MKSLISYLASRYFFLFACIVFIFLFINLSIQDYTVEPTALGINEYVGKVINYSVPMGNKQRIMISDQLHRLKVFIYLPREKKVNKGDSIICKGSGVLANSAFTKAQNVRIIVSNCEEITINKGSNLIQKVVNSLRLFIERVCRNHLPEPQSSLLLGMLIGSDEEFTEDFDTSLLLSGTTHIIAVSGYNVNFLTGLLLIFTRYINKNRLMLLIVPVLVVYLIVIGIENIPALRATIMNIYLLFGQMLGIKIDFLNSIGLSLLIILLINPFSVLSVSLYLSYLAVISQNGLSPFVAKYIKQDSLRTSLVCLVGTLPVTIIIFQEFFPWSLIINVLIAPLIPIIMELVIITFPLLYIFPNFTTIIILPLRFLLQLLIDIIGLAVKLPFNRIKITDSVWLLITITLIIIFIIVIKKHRNEAIS